MVNAAITSTWTHHHLIYLNQRILGFDPDMVLFLDGYNDFFYFRGDHDQFASYGSSLPAQTILGEPTLGSLAYANGWWLFRTSAFGHLLSRALRSLKYMMTPRAEQKPIDVDRAMSGLRKVFPENALKMQRRAGLILVDEGVEAVFMLQPILMLDRARPGLTEVEKALVEFDLEARRPNYERFLERAVEFIRIREQQTSEEIGTTFLDLTRIYDGIDEQMFTDYTHLTPAGNAILAEAVADAILPIIRKSQLAGE